MKQLKYGNDEVVPLYTSLGMYLLVHAGIQVYPC